jgi:hypothetical protein
MIHHPAIADRRIVILGDYSEAQAWIERHDIDVTRVVFAATARQIVSLQPHAIHLVVLPGIRDWRNPYHFMLRTELNYMHAKGATLEWA